MKMPNVPVEAVVGFSKVWRSPGGLTILLDDTSKQFALDFARVTLKSFIQQMVAAQQAADKAAQTKAAPAATGGIVLTDA